MPSRSGTEVGGARLKEKFLVRINSGGKICFLSYNIKKKKKTDVCNKRSIYRKNIDIDS